MKPFITSLWFDNDAEAAANFYVSVFKNGKVGNIARYSEAGQEIHGQKPGSAMSVEFEINNQKFVGINGGPIFKPNESFSTQIMCDTQDEIDYYWNAFLAGGGSPSQCGWLKDKWGFSWQVASTSLARMMADPDKKKAGRVTEAMMKMQKLDIATLERAYAG
jgi:predicted 3-demethylubiquinone-9 3-methyltransferase (glyoxalase superfamily)